MWHFRGSRHTLTSPTHFLGSRSPNPLWSRYTPLDSRVADCVQLFCSPTTDTQHPSFRQSASSTLCLSLYLSLSLSLVGAVALRLQQHQPHRTLDAYRFVCSLYLMRQQDWCATAANTTIFHVYCMRARHWLLIPDCQTYCIPSGSSCVCLPQHHGIRISGERLTVGSRRWLTKAPTIWVESQTGRSALQTENSRRSSLRRGCNSRLKRLTSRCHLFTVFNF